MACSLQPLGEEHGGLGLDATGIATVLEALGRGLVVEPLTEAVLSPREYSLKAAPAALAEAWLPGLLDGSRRVALAHAEAGSRSGRLHVATSVAGGGESVTITGHKPHVIGGYGAGGFIVSARTSGAAGDAAGLGLYFVESTAPGLARGRLASGRWFGCGGADA